MDIYQKSLSLHEEWKGKLTTDSKIKIDNRDALALAYTPGVAEPCLAIQKNVDLSYELTRRWNTVAVVTDGKITEKGTHDELMAKGGIYKELYELQFRTD